MPRVRFTVRRMLIAVAFISAITAEGWRSWRWHHHDRAEQANLIMVELQRESARYAGRTGGLTAKQFDGRARMMDRDAAAHASLKRGYESHGWLRRLFVGAIRLPPR